MKSFNLNLDESLSAIKKHTVLLLAVTFLLGAFTAFWARFVLVQKDDVHYHANFALYVDGERETFDSFTFYEEVSACTGDFVNDPHTRVHMHDQINHVVHVHDRAATWGHFFSNLSYGLSNKSLATNAGVFIDGGDGNKLRFYLNGEQVSSIANEVIQSEDTLLIDYGKDSDNTLKDRYSEIVKDADAYNKRQDPSSCSGGKPESFAERFRRTLGIDTTH